MLDRIKRAAKVLFGKSADTNDAFIALTLGQRGQLPRGYRPLSIQGYGKNVYVYRAIRFISQGMANIPWLLFRDKGDGAVQEIHAHPLLDLIHQPNPMMGQREYFEFVIGYYHIDGNAPVVRLGPGANGGGVPPRELWPLQPDQVRIVTLHRDGTGPIVAFKVGHGQDEKTYPAEQVLHLKTFNPLDQRKGLSPLSVGIASVVQGNEARAWNIALLKNSARPPGILRTDQEIGEEQFERLREEVTRVFAGAPNAGKPALLEGGLDWKSTSLNPAEMEWLAGQVLAAKEIAINFGLAPEILGDAANKTYSNFKEARKAGYEEVVVPMAKWIRDEYNEWLVPHFGDDLFLDLDLEQVPALQDDRDSLFSRAEKATWLSIDEKRGMTGFETYDPDESPGSKIYIPLTLVPLGAGAGSQTEEDAQRAAILERAGKAFGLDTDELKTVYWKQVNDLRARFNGRVAQMIAGQLRSDVKAVETAVAGAPSPDAVPPMVDAALREHLDDWRALYARIYLSVGRAFAEQVLNSLKAALPPDVKQDELRSIWDEEITAWASTNAENRISLVNFTTGQRIRSSLADGISAGESILALSDRVSQFGLPDIISNRSEVIARTEVISASNLGSRAGARSTGLPLQREWITSRDGRVRGLDPKDATDHAGMDRQLRNFDDPYDESRMGEQLMFPGDTSLGASAANVIQCRCTEGYRVLR